ncbi:MAG: GNAT family N-acetyltransferase [Sphingomicrobium sp.]
MGDWTISEGELHRQDVGDLLRQHVAEMNAGSPPSACHVLAADALSDPAIRFFTLRDGAGRLLGCGALKRLADDHGEIKSMRTADAALGLGVGGRMLDLLTEAARLSGMRRLSLETGNSPLFAAANRLYEREGYQRCEPFGGYVATSFTHFYTREI